MSVKNLTTGKKRVRLGTVLMFVGAIAAYLIGSGFATGQESLQYFSAFGPVGATGALVVTLIMYCYFTSIALRDGRNLRLKSTDRIFEYYCGKYIGKFFGIFAPAFFFCMFAVMLSGAGAALHEYFGWSAQVGIFAMAIVTLATVLLGLDRMVAVVSLVGPVIVVLALIVGVAGIIMNPSGIVNSEEAFEGLNIMQAAPNWVISGFIFPALGILMLVPFLAGIGRKAASDREAVTSGLAGGLTFVVAVAIVAFGLIANIGDVYDKQIPMLWIASQVFSGAGVVFSVVLFLGIYTTAVPLLWVSVNRLANEERSRKARILAVAGTVIGVLLAQIPFASLVNLLYPIAGYLALVLMAGMVVRQIRNARARKQGRDVYDVNFERVPAL